MATIFFAEPELVVGHGRRVLFVNPDDLQIFKEIELPPDLATCGLKAPEPGSCPATGPGPGQEQQLAAAAADGAAAAGVVGLPSSRMQQPRVPVQGQQPSRLRWRCKM